MLMLPRVRLVRLLSSEIAAAQSKAREPPSQPKLLSTSAPEVIELASAPAAQTEQDSSFAAMEVTEPARKPYIRSERRSSRAAIGGTDPASEPSELRSRSNKRDSTFAAPRVTEPAALKPLSPKEQNSQYGPMDVTDSIQEPRLPNQRSPSVSLTVKEAATASERCQSPNPAELSYTASVYEAAALNEPRSPLSSQKPTSAAQESPEPKQSSVGQNSHQEPCSSDPREILKVAQSREYDYNLRFYNDKVENYVCHECFIFQVSESWPESCEMRAKMFSP